MDRRRKLPVRDQQRGSVATIALMTTLVVATLGIGGATLGRLVAARMDAQRAADAAALSAADLIREEGMGVDDGGAFALGQLNSRLPAEFGRMVNETPTSVVVGVTSGIDIAAPRFVFGDGSLTAHAKGSAMVGQVVFEQATWRVPKLMLVLDFSGSMGSMLGTRMSLDVLKAAVQKLIDLDIRIEFGAVFYSDDAFYSMGDFRMTQDERLHGILGALRQYGPQSGTATDAGLRAAYDAFDDTDADDTGRYVLLVSDGAPNDEGAAHAQAEKLWSDLDATIFTLHVDQSGGDGGTGNFMVSVSGTPDAHPDRDYYFHVSDDSELEDTFKSIVASMVCSIGFPDPSVVEDPDTVRVFLRSGPGGAETKLRYEDDLGKFPRDLAFRYEPQSGLIRMTFRACSEIIEGGQQAVVRYNHARLVE